MPPPAPTPALLPGTPYKSRADGKNRHSNTKPLAKDNRAVHCKEMEGLIIGPMDIDEYLERFTRISDEAKLPPQPEVTFDAVPLESTNPVEADMYPHLVSTDFNA